MLRTMYIWLLRMHPASFRSRFGDEMLDIYDQSPERAWRWLADACLSVVRQRLFRQPEPEPALATAVPAASAWTPAFRSLDDDKLGPSALLDGVILSIAFFAFFVFLMNHGAVRRPLLFIGVHHKGGPRPLPVVRSSLEGKPLTTTVTIPEAGDPWRPIGLAYFKAMRVVNVLDADQDLVISQWEILTAADALRRLDVDHNGELSPEECGFPLGAVRIMSAHPVLAALDADHNGTISAAEIRGSSAALRKLDRNGDGNLTPDEVIPENAAVQAQTVLAVLDTNGDGTISALEQENSDPQLRTLLNSADKDGNGVTTREELLNELRRRQEAFNQLQRAKHQTGLHY